MQSAFVSARGGGYNRGRFAARGTGKGREGGNNLFLSAFDVDAPLAPLLCSLASISSKKKLILLSNLSLPVSTRDTSSSSRAFVVIIFSFICPASGEEQFGREAKGKLIAFCDFRKREEAAAAAMKDSSGAGRRRRHAWRRMIMPLFPTLSCHDSAPILFDALATSS